MSDDVSLRLSHDEALVLHDWLVRFNGRADPAFADQAEQRVLWDLEATLERTLVEPFQVDYEARLSTARARLRDE